MSANNVIEIKNKNGQLLAQCDGKVWTFRDTSGENHRKFHEQIVESPVWLFHFLDVDGEGEKLLVELSQTSPEFEELVSKFFIDKKRLEDRTILFEKAGSGVIDSFVHRISLAGDATTGFSIDATIECDWSHFDQPRNAFGEIITVSVFGILNADGFIEAIDSITSDEHWDEKGWTWNETIARFRAVYPKLASAVEEKLRDRGSTNVLRLKNEGYYFKRCESYYNAQRYDLALDCANEGIAKFPFCEVLYASRGEAHFAKGAIEPALADYETAIQLGMDAAAVFTNAGLCSAILRDYEKSIEYLSHAIEIDPNNTNIQFARAKSYRALGNNELAEKDEDRAKRLSSSAENLRQFCEIHGTELINKEEPFGGFETLTKEGLEIQRRLHLIRDQFFPNPWPCIDCRKVEWAFRTAFGHDIECAEFPTWDWLLGEDFD